MFGVGPGELGPPYLGGHERGPVRDRALGRQLALPGDGRPGRPGRACWPSAGSSGAPPCAPGGGGGRARRRARLGPRRLLGRPSARSPWGHAGRGVPAGGAERQRARHRRARRPRRRDGDQPGAGRHPLRVARAAARRPPVRALRPGGDPVHPGVRERRVAPAAVGDRLAGRGAADGRAAAGGSRRHRRAGPRQRRVVLGPAGRRPARPHRRGGRLDHRAGAGGAGLPAPAGRRAPGRPRALRPGCSRGSRASP